MIEGEDRRTERLFLLLLVAEAAEDEELEDGVNPFELLLSFEVLVRDALQHHRRGLAVHRGLGKPMR